MISKPWLQGLLVLSDAGSSEPFTSFREIISVVGASRVWGAWFERTNGDVVQVKYTNQMSPVFGSVTGKVQCFDRK